MASQISSLSDEERVATRERLSRLATGELVHIGMGLPCDHPFCAEHAEPLFRQLSVERYSRSASVMACPRTLAEWRSEHRTARRGALKAERRGYVFAEVDFSLYANDIYAINVSRENRQGRPMTDGYRRFREHGQLRPHQMRCPLHRTHTYGVLHARKLVAYLTLHRSGELAMVSTIIGHGDYEDRDEGLMYLLIQGVIADQAPLPGHYFYNVHSSGEDGLRFKKERYGFRPADIEWSLA